MEAYKISDEELVFLGFGAEGSKLCGEGGDDVGVDAAAAIGAGFNTGHAGDALFGIGGGRLLGGDGAHGAGGNADAAAAAAVIGLCLERQAAVLLVGAVAGQLQSAHFAPELVGDLLGIVSEDLNVLGIGASGGKATHDGMLCNGSDAGSADKAGT